MKIPAAYSHQVDTTKFIIDHPRCLITSDPGTGKTRAVLDAHFLMKGKTLVLAPLSILEAAWADDIIKFQPNINYGVAYAKNREKVTQRGSPWASPISIRVVNAQRNSMFQKLCFCPIFLMV